MHRSMLFVGRIAIGLGIVIAVSSVPLPSRGQTGTRVSTSDELTRLAELFKIIGMPEVKNTSWANVSYGPDDQPFHMQGWLLNRGAGKTVIFTTNGLRSFRKPHAGEQRPSNGGELDLSVAWDVSVADFPKSNKSFLAEGIAFLQAKAPAGQDVGRWRNFQQEMLPGHIVAAVGQAVFAHESGRHEDAEELIAHPREAHRLNTKNVAAAKDKAESLCAFVAKQLGGSARSAAIGGARSPTGGMSRRELLQQWAVIAALPDHPYRDEAKSLVQDYEALVKEDDRWVEPTEKAIADMTPDQKAAYWLHHLRDIEFRDSNAGWVNDTRPKKPHPAEELKNLGVAALPRVISHLDDTRPTRWSELNERWPDGGHLIRYGDCCAQLFEAMTCCRLDAAEFPIKEGKGRQIKVRAERWWQEYQKKGEQRMLVEGAARGEPDSVAYAERLATKHRAVALAPIVEGARMSKDATVRTKLIEIANRLEDPRGIVFLREELSGPFRESRLKAATALVEDGDPSATKALLKEWRDLHARKVDLEDGKWPLDEILTAMLATGDPEAIRIVQGNMPLYDFSMRSTIISSAAAIERSFSRFDEYSQSWKSVKRKRQSPEARQAIDELLITAFGDSEEEQISMSSGGKILRYPMLSDRAAEGLAERWKHPDLFDIYAPLQVRLRQHDDIKRVWQKKLGKPELPRTVEPIQAAPDDTMEPLLKAIVNSGPGRKNAVKAIENIGLPALPALRKALTDIPEGHPAQAELTTLVRRFALTVRQVRVTADSVPPAEPVRSQLNGFKGKPIDETAFMDLLHSISRNLPEGVRGVRITFERIPDDSGVFLMATLIPERTSRIGTYPNFRSGYRAMIGSSCLVNAPIGGTLISHSGHTADGRPLGIADIDWSDFRKVLRLALQAEPNRYVLVQAQCYECR